MRSIWDRELTTKRMVHNAITISVVRNVCREYPRVTTSSRQRLESLFPLAEYVGASLFVFPDGVRRPTPRALDASPMGVAEK
jgi:hypothetical protein